MTDGLKGTSEALRRGRVLAAGVDPRDSVLRLPPDVRRSIYTTNSLESVHPQDHQDPWALSDG